MCRHIIGLPRDPRSSNLIEHFGWRLVIYPFFRASMPRHGIQSYSLFWSDAAGEQWRSPTVWPGRKGSQRKKIRRLPPTTQHSRRLVMAVLRKRAQPNDLPKTPDLLHCFPFIVMVVRNVRGLNLYVYSSNVLQVWTTVVILLDINYLSKGRETPPRELQEPRYRNSLLQKISELNEQSLHLTRRGFMWPLCSLCNGIHKDKHTDQLRTAHYGNRRKWKWLSLESAIRQETRNATSEEIPRKYRCHREAPLTISFPARFQHKLCLDLIFRLRRTSLFQPPHERSSCIRGRTGAVRRYSFQRLSNLFDVLEAQLAEKKDGENCTVVIQGTISLGSGYWDKVSFALSLNWGGRSWRRIAFF